MKYVASFPGHQTFSRSRGEKKFSPWLRDQIWEWPGNKATYFVRARGEPGNEARFAHCVIKLAVPRPFPPPGFDLTEKV